VGPRAGLDTEDREKNPLPPPGIEPRSPGRPARSQTVFGIRLSSPSITLIISSIIILKKQKIRVPV
jgi:hypothetical protein